VYDPRGVVAVIVDSQSYEWHLDERRVEINSRQIDRGNTDRSRCNISATLYTCTVLYSYATGETTYFLRLLNCGRSVGVAGSQCSLRQVGRHGTVSTRFRRHCAIQPKDDLNVV
jgi:hypothetical protein